MNLLRALLAFATLTILLLDITPFSHADSLSIGKDIPYSLLIDEKGDFTFEQAERSLRHNLAESQTTLSRGYTKDTFWIRFELPKKLFNQENRWLELGPNFVDDIQLFFREKGGDGEWQIHKTGDLLNGVSELNYRNPVFILPTPGVDTQGYEVLIRVRSTSTVILSASLWAPNEFLGHASRSTSFWSFYFGLAALSSLLALIMAITLRTWLLWSATAFSVTYALVFCIQGFINWMFPGLAFPLQHYATSVFTLSSYAMLMWMSSEIINLRTKLPWAHRLLMWACFMMLALIALIPLNQYATAIKIKTLLLFFTYALFFYAAAYLWIKGRFPVATLAMAAIPSFLMVASLFSLLSILGWVPFYPELYVLWQYAVVVNMLMVLAISILRLQKRRLKEFEQQKLANELEAEREASFNQRQFIGTVSHEFRTPLAIISAALENLRFFEDADSERLARYQKIERANDRLIQLTDNCLADARLMTDVTALNLQPTDLLQLVSSAASLVHVSDVHHLVLTVDGQPASNGQPASIGDSPAYKVLADPAMLRIAISNVIDNAVKYSGGGNICIDCREAGSNVLVRICDEGPGIGDVNAEVLFQRYRRGASTKQGSGLGLFVARQIAQTSGGNLRFIDDTPQGSCFEFMLKKAQ